MEIKKLTNLDQFKVDNNEKMAIYGAASTGEFCLRILESKGIRVDNFVDDDVRKSGTTFHNIDVVLPEGFFEDKMRNYCVFIGSIFFYSIYERIRKDYTDYNIVFFDISIMYEHEKYEMQKSFMMIHDKKFVWENFDKLYSIYFNDESKGIIDTMKMVYAKQYNHFDVYRQICTKEEQYFTQDMLAYFGDRKVSILDGGAYRGELLSDIVRHNIRVEEIFLVEVNGKNYKELQNNIIRYQKHNLLGAGVQLIQKGLWNNNGVVYIDGEDETCKIVDYKTSDMMEVVTIDEIIDGRKIDFIKMDIEGAELHALRGGIKTIQKNRPALAVCVYHSPEDFVGIPLYLSEKLEGYRFSLLHHTNEYVETILYAYPL